STVMDSRAAGTNPDAFSIDMDPGATPANTATSLGSRQACARIDENNTLDQDEDVTADTLSIDVTATNIPASDPMIAYGYTLNYNEAALTLQSADHNFLNFANGGTLFNGSDGLPDANNNNQWVATVVDTDIIADSGSGVLTRLTISSDAGVLTTEYPLTLTFAAAIDPSQGEHPPDVINNAKVAINQACDAPTPTPLPHVQGDVDCSGAVLATDALKVLRHIAGLTVVQTEPCDDIGTGTPLQGDVDCTGAVLATDALKILRHIAGLSVVQTEPCDNIGT
ncbi:MAG TPA: hypothetical protein VFP63_02175, partial [Dehalococcoidia bacterium]|nr:hypothetical protein [Dehalococcoidia bacterium]